MRLRTASRRPCGVLAGVALLVPSPHAPDSPAPPLSRFPRPPAEGRSSSLHFAAEERHRRAGSVRRRAALPIPQKHICADCDERHKRTKSLRRKRPPRSFFRDRSCCQAAGESASLIPSLGSTGPRRATPSPPRLGCELGPSNQVQRGPRFAGPLPAAAAGTGTEQAGFRPALAETDPGLAAASGPARRVGTAEPAPGAQDPEPPHSNHSREGAAARGGRRGAETAGERAARARQQRASPVALRPRRQRSRPGCAALRPCILLDGADGSAGIGGPGSAGSESAGTPTGPQQSPRHRETS